MSKLAIHRSYHDLNATIFNGNKIIEHFEAERYFKEKNFNFSEENTDKFLKILSERYGTSWDEIRVSSSNKFGHKKVFDIYFSKYFNSKYTEVPHHFAHSNSVLGSHDSLHLVIDGTSNDGVLNLFHKNKRLECNYQNYFLGKLYHYISNVIMISCGEEWSETPEGKAMALVAYGKYNQKLTNEIYSVIKNIKTNRNLLQIYSKLLSYFEQKCYEWINKYGKEDTIYNFQEIWISEILDILNSYKNLSNSLCFSGGAALNIELNRRLIDLKWFDKIYFTPVSNDSGIGIGCFEYNDFTPFCGPKLFDKASGYDLSLDECVNIINDNKLLGTLIGRSEVGPRALGHRSILCNPTNSTIKDHINSKVKYRHDFQPFGCIVAEDKAYKYFDLDIPVEYMNVKVDSKTDLFPAITHYDNSSRIQTINKISHPFLYDVLMKLEHPVLLNTSFNEKGKPIINWFKDAKKMLDDGKIDMLCVKDQ